MRILGIDPGYERIGIAILEKNKDDKTPKSAGATVQAGEETISSLIPAGPLK